MFSGIWGGTSSQNKGSGPGPCRSPARGCKLTVTPVPFSPPGHTSCRPLLAAPSPPASPPPTVQRSLHRVPTPGPQHSAWPPSPPLSLPLPGSLWVASHLGASCFRSHLPSFSTGPRLGIRWSPSSECLHCPRMMPAWPPPRGSPHLEPRCGARWGLAPVLLWDLSRSPGPCLSMWS